MDIWFVVMELVLLLGGAFMMGALAQRLGQSPIIGYLLAGTIVGPSWPSITRWAFSTKSTSTGRVSPPIRNQDPHFRDPGEGDYRRDASLSGCPLQCWCRN